MIHGGGSSRPSCRCRGKTVERLVGIEATTPEERDAEKAAYERELELLRNTAREAMSRFTTLVHVDLELFGSTVSGAESLLGEPFTSARLVYSISVTQLGHWETSGSSETSDFFDAQQRRAPPR